MKNLQVATALLIFTSFSLLVGCVPNLEQQPYTKDSPISSSQPSGGIIDSVPTIDLSSTQTEVEWATLKIMNNQIFIDAANLESSYGVIPSEIRISFDDAGNIRYMRVNSSVMFDELANTNYTYLDAGVLVVEKGNTANRIAKDHKISIAQLKALNPTKNISKLRVGDAIKVY